MARRATRNAQQTIYRLYFWGFGTQCKGIGVSIFIGVYRLYTTPPTKRKQKENCLRFVGGVVTCITDICR